MTQRSGSNVCATIELECLLDESLLVVRGSD